MLFIIKLYFYTKIFTARKTRAVEDIYHQSHINGRSREVVAAKAERLKDLNGELIVQADILYLLRFNLG